MSEPTRVSIDLGEAAYAKLVSLRENTGAKTNAETIRRALELYMWATEEWIKGFTVAATKEKGSSLKIKEFLPQFPFLGKS